MPQIVTSIPRVCVAWAACEAVVADNGWAHLADSRELVLNNYYVATPATPARALHSFRVNVL